MLRNTTLIIKYLLFIHNQFHLFYQYKIIEFNYQYFKFKMNNRKFPLFNHY